MRIFWAFVVGTLAIGCKDKAPTPAGARPMQATQEPTAPATPDRPSGGAASHATARPTLELASEFSAEQQDAAWAGAAEKAIAAVAPDLVDIECRQSQCRATVRAATEAELVAQTERLQLPDGLPSTEAKNVLLTAPELVDGKHVMTIYVRYDR